MAAAYLIRSQSAYEQTLKDLAKRGYRYKDGQALEEKPVFTKRIVLVTTEQKEVIKESIAKYNGDIMYTKNQYRLYIVD